MPELREGESVPVQGSARLPYLLKNVGGVYSCSCPAWRNQSLPIERRTCKHLRQYRGEAAEAERLASFGPLAAIPTDKPSTAPALLLAESWDGESNPAGWWLSEKLDGVRAYWDRKQFLSRQGNPFHAPGWFTAPLPPMPLDGELWLARKAFQRTVSIIRRQDQSDHWKQLCYVVFDAPAVPAPFEERLHKVGKHCYGHSPYFRVLEHFRCKGRVHLLSELERVCALGGEGVMLRKAGSLYEARRSPTLLKVKKFLDGEARVVAQMAGAGRHKGRLGALAVELADGTQFSVGSGLTDAQRENPPPVGSVITFRYQELTERGVPRFPTFVRPRPDITWPPADVRPEPAPSNLSSVNERPILATSSQRKKPSMNRRFEFIGGNSAKFYEVRVVAKLVTVRYGRIGTDGQTQTKEFKSALEAQVHAERLIAQKTKKGYQEVALA